MQQWATVVGKGTLLSWIRKRIADKGFNATAITELNHQCTALVSRFERVPELRRVAHSSPPLRTEQQRDSAGDRQCSLTLNVEVFLLTQERHKLRNFKVSIISFLTYLNILRTFSNFCRINRYVQRSHPSTMLCSNHVRGLAHTLLSLRTGT